MLTLIAHTARLVIFRRKSTDGGANLAVRRNRGAMRRSAGLAQPGTADWRDRRRGRDRKDEQALVAVFADHDQAVFPQPHRIAVTLQSKRDVYRRVEYVHVVEERIAEAGAFARMHREQRGVG